MGLALIIELFSLIVLRCAPFGGNSLAVVDASIQYLDFFAYLKDCLAGKNNIFYTFSKTLGGTNVAVFSYYLASPVNFLVVFFNKENFHTFFDLLVVIKLSFAAFSFSFFLKNRFQSLRNVFVISLGICYAFCQYNIAQACCIMWLDGVVMLPFILLGIHKFITEGKFLMLSLSVAFSMIFNWYTGAINCIFSAFFFVFEWGVRVAKYDKDFSLKKLKTGFFLGLKCASFMLAGVFLAAFLLIPTFTSLKNGRGHIDWNLFKNIYMYFDVPTILQGFLLVYRISNNWLYFQF